MDIPPPPAFKPDRNETGLSWKAWKQGFEVYLEAKDLATAPGKRTVNILLHLLGQDGIKLYNTFDFRTAVAADPDQGIQAIVGEDKYDLQTVLRKFDNHYGKGKLRNLRRQSFLKRKQQADESVMDFVADLKHLVQSCEYGQIEESILCDRIIDGIHDQVTMGDLLDLEGDELNLENCIKICRKAELTRVQLATVSQTTQEISHVHSFGRGYQRGQQRGQRYSYNRRYEGNPRSLRQMTNKTKSLIECEYCCRRHERKNCPAYDQYCGSCGAKGHYKRSRKCPKNCQQPTSRFRGRRRGQGHQQNTNSRTVHSVMNTRTRYDNDIDRCNDMFEQCSTHDIFSCTNNDTESNSWYVEFNVHDKPLTLKVDTGAGCNLISKQTLVGMGIHETKPSDVVLKGINACEKSVGQIKLPCMYKGVVHMLDFQVLNGNGVDLLGKQDSTRLGIVTRIDSLLSVKQHKLLIKYQDVFDNTIGLIPGQYHIRLDRSVHPVVTPPRPVPAPIREQVKSELDHLERTGIIAKVNVPTDWVSPMVCVRKPSGRVRICIDPFHLNTAIMREHHPMNSVDDIITRLNGSNYYTVIDANSGFYQIKLSEESANYTTFSTPFGRYKHLRLPMGICSAPEIYQRAMSDLFSDLEGVEIVMDDILIHGKTMAEHDKRLEAVLERCRKNNLKMNPKKTKVAQSEVNYVGHILTRDGVKPSNERIKSIVNMRDPENLSELQTILGMISYVSKFIPHLSDLNAPLRELKKQREWMWGDKERNAFKLIKEALISTPVLRYYDVNSPVTLTVDASRKGLGAAIIQKNGVVAYASRALTPAEQRYAQIELEMLAIVFGCTRFHHLIYGMKNVVVESDHKPLEALHMKPLHSSPMRIQKMRLKLQPYTYTVKYIKGSCIGLADCLSRLPQPYNKEDIADTDSYMVCKVETLTSNYHDKLASATSSDEELQAVIKLILQGWPEHRHQVPVLASAYWEHRDSLGTYDGIVYRGERICIPQSLRGEMLKTLHSSHMGMVYTKHRARDIMFWPGMNRSIEELIKRCSTCLEYRNRPPKEPLKSHPVPELPWSNVSSDLFTLHGHNYIVLVDAYSGFIEVEELSDTSAKSVIRMIKANIARYGIMKTLISDNGPQYNCREFREFVSAYKFDHVTSSPEYAQSNGLAERAVQTVKQLIRKAVQNGQDIYLSLLEMRNIPRTTSLGSPVQRLMGRRTKTLLPTTEALLKPQIIPPEIVKHQLEDTRLKQKHYYDNGKRPLPDIQPRDAIRLYTPTGWKPAEYRRSDQTPRSHIVKSGPLANEYRRNRNRIMVTAEEPHVLTPIIRRRGNFRRHSVSQPATNNSGDKHPSRPPDQPPEIPIVPYIPIQPSATKSTRSGRNILQPSYLKDYVV